MLKRVIPYAHELIQCAVKPGDVVIDATCGNGHDTVMLCRATGEHGKVYAFDIQLEAIEQTKQKLQSESLANVQLIHDGHQHLNQYLAQEDHGRITAAIFNLGYLPGSDKTIITKPAETLSAIDQIISHLKPGGIIVCVVYHGHPGGEVEKATLLNHLSQLEQREFNVLQYGFINQKNKPPFILAIEKKQTD
ncbi:class I SAM-dependent methyltransferase [Amphibacillus sp. Q70]|uniref:tRNA (mnm(5)s(2)U34)-methyltransferase n=1 Tax=Amphibacillus sp. Q70 TaxID=3453416 RepID=UPI003F82BD4A